MFKRTLCTVVLLLAFTELSYAAAVSLTLPVNCDNGIQTGTGTLDQGTGAIAVSFPLNQCAKDGLNISGLVNLSGIANLQTGAVNVTINYGHVTVTEGGNTITSPSCALNLDGVYNAETGIFDGTQSIGCVWNGNIQAAINEVVFILFL